MLESYSPKVYSRDLWTQLPWDTEYSDKVFIFIYMLLLLSSLNNVTSVAFNFVKSYQDYSLVLLIHLAKQALTGIRDYLNLANNRKGVGTVHSLYFLSACCCLNPWSHGNPKSIKNTKYHYGIQKRNIWYLDLT